MTGQLPSKEQRKYFYTIIFLMLIAIFLIRHMLMPYLSGQKIELNNEVLYKILDDLFTSILVTIGLGIFLFWLTPKNKANAQIKILQPIEIGSTMTKARLETEKWWFNGGSGRYTRSQTLPYLANLARQRGKSIEVVIQIMNPNNQKTCRRYAEYRNSLKSGMRNKKSEKSVQIDLLSTIVAAYMWRYEQPLLDITLGLKDSFSLFRTDISSTTALITKEDPIEPALLYENGTFFYDAYCQDLKQSLNQVTRLDMSISFVGVNEIAVSNTKELLQHLGFSDLVNDSEIGDIISKAKSNENPYG
ncbi:MAG: hypothetical protein ACJ75B_11575 [Flavisolibacter sp.]